MSGQQCVCIRYYSKHFVSELISSLQSPFEIGAVTVSFCKWGNWAQSIVWRRVFMLLQRPKDGLGIVIGTLNSSVFPSFMGTGGQNIWNWERSKKFRLYGSLQVYKFSVIILLFKSTLISTHKIYVEKLTVGLLGCKLFTSSFFSK